LNNEHSNPEILMDEDFKINCRWPYGASNGPIPQPALSGIGREDAKEKDD